MIRFINEQVKGFISILVSMAVTLRYLFTHAITVQYPDERLTLPERYRGLHILRRDPETGKELCTACGLCARVCPVNMIDIVPEGTGKERRPAEYKMDLTLCMFCGLCVEICPTDALKETGEYELGAYTREDIIYRKSRLMRENHIPESKIVEKRD